MKIKFFVLVVICVAFLVGCVRDDSDKSLQNFGDKRSGDGLEYTLLWIDDMPCVWFQYGIDIDRGRAGYAGLTCDWSRWKGE